MSRLYYEQAIGWPIRGRERIVNSGMADADIALANEQNLHTPSLIGALSIKPSVPANNVALLRYSLRDPQATEDRHLGEVQGECKDHCRRECSSHHECGKTSHGNSECRQR